MSSDGIYAVVDTAPAPVGGMAALAERLVYPDSARAVAAEGVVLITFVVQPDGTPRDLAVLRAPHPSLGASARDAVAATAFTPGLVGGEPVPTRVTLPLRFELPDAPPDAGIVQEISPVGGWARLVESVSWPAEARRHRVSGTLTLAVAIEADGQLASAEVVGTRLETGQERAEVRVTRIGDVGESGQIVLPSPRRPSLEDKLTRAVLDAVLDATFIPEIQNGEPVRGQIRVVLPFDAAR